MRVLKYGAFFMAVMLPGCLFRSPEYTLELFPPQLLYKVAAAEFRHPLPLFLEMVFVIVLLEIIHARQACGCPSPLGIRVSLVAALIVGDRSHQGRHFEHAGADRGGPDHHFHVCNPLAVRAGHGAAHPVCAGRRPVWPVWDFDPDLFDGAQYLWNEQLWPALHGADQSAVRQGALQDGILRFPWQKLAQKPFNVNDLPGGEEKYEPERTD